LRKADTQKKVRKKKGGGGSLIKILFLLYFGFFINRNFYKAELGGI